MRRLTRLRQASGLLHGSPPPPPCRSRCFAAAHINSSNSFSTSQPRPSNRADAANAAPTAVQDPPSAQPDAAAGAAEPADAAAQPPAPHAEHLQAPAAIAGRGAGRQWQRMMFIETDLVLPPARDWAPDPKETSYVPAVTGDGLKMVGGLDGWWEQEGHWSGRLAFAPFLAATKVQDAAALEAVVRRAVVEALAVRAVSEGMSRREAPLTGRWAVGGREAAMRALGVPIQVAEDGTARLEGEVPANLFTDLAVAVEAAPAEEGVEEAVEEADALNAGEAAALVETWDPSWKSMSLDDVTLKFTVTKRVQQLSGHILVDSKLKDISTVNDLLKVLITPPKPKKLADEIKARGELTKLPNVAVYDRRITPIDKDKMVGRWKVVVQELEKRDLPVTGKGKHGRSVEKSWVRGGI